MSAMEKISPGIDGNAGKANNYSGLGARGPLAELADATDSKSTASAEHNGFPDQNLVESLSHTGERQPSDLGRLVCKPISPVRLQRSRAKGARLVSPNGLPVVCVTRGTMWGNPFSPRRAVAEIHVASAAEAVESFRLLMLGDWALLRRYRWLLNRHEMLAGALHELRGKNLACWCGLCPAHRATGKPLNVDCADCEPCHCDTLGELANAPAGGGA